jgi:hypothetical protein
MSRAWLVVIGLLMTLLMVWMLRTLVVAPEPTGPPAPPAVAPNAIDEAVSGDAVAAGFVAGVPAGYPPTEQGAATAAVNWVAALPTLLEMGPVRLTDTLARFWSTRAVGEIEATVTDYFALADRAEGDLSNWVWVEAPIRTRVAPISENAVEAQVWAVLIVGDRVDGPVEAMWRTHSLELVWEAGDWRIDRASVLEGPTPDLISTALPSPVGDFAIVDTWQPAVFVNSTPSVGGR